MSLDTAQTTAGGPPPPPKAQTPPAPVATARVKARRRPWVFALMAALVAAGALGTAFAFTSVNDTQEVLVVSNDIKRGEIIEAGDLAVVRVSVDPAGISLTPGQMPSEPLYSGDAVRIVTTPGDQGEVTDKDPVTVEAVVVGVSRVEETGETVVDVSVPESDAADLAARAATGRVALVLDARER